MDVEFNERVKRAKMLLIQQYHGKGLKLFLPEKYDLGVNLQLGTDDRVVSNIARNTAQGLGLDAIVSTPQKTDSGLVVYVKLVEQKETPAYESTIAQMKIALTRIGPPENLTPELRRRYGGCGEGCTYSD